MSAPRLLLPLLMVCSLVSLGLAVSSGSVNMSWADYWAVLSGHGDELLRTVILEIRLPRALCAYAIGGSLAVSGALMQALLRNPLADPYILGVSGGAAVGALSTMLLGLGGVWFTGGAVLGALVTILLVFVLAHGAGTWTSTRLLLTGVVIAAGWGAVISFILSISPDSDLRTMLFWLMGDLTFSQLALWPLALLAVGVLVALPYARHLNLYARGEQQAMSLGVPVTGLRIYVYLAASLLTAAAVTTAGSIGFVGLIIPHLLRLLGGHDYRLLLPAAALLGGSFLVVADTVARTVLAPQQLPVGVITALLGVPVFLYLLQRGHRP